MADGPAPAAPPTAPREQRWRGVLLALAAFVFLPQAFAFQAALPVAETMLLLVPVLAVCFLLGWWQGGRFWLALLWAAAAVAGVVLPAREAGGMTAYGDLARSWALLSAGTFGVVSLVAPRKPFFPRALSAIGLALLLGMMVLLVSGKSPQQVQAVYAEQIQARNRENAAALRTQLDALERQKVIEPGPTDTFLRELADESVRQAEAIGRVAAEAFPALLALETLAALALAWALYHRLSRTRIGPALSPLRDFRFNDQMVWGF
ncbi:MAG TPA: hypothetical protein VFS05_06575, partial [Gemmatimonadaceae bacterium]|nr:hypothetical protein [Gemmatimonadaceae bacterium]